MRFLTFLFLAIFFAISPMMAYAFDPSALADSITAFSNSLSFTESSAVVMVVAFVVDFLVKKFPSKNPTGLIHGIAKVLKGIVAILNALVSLVEKIAAFFDKVTAQNLKQ